MTFASPHAGDNRNAARLVCCAVALLSVAAGVIHVSAAADHTNLPVMMAGFLVVATLQVGLGGLLVWRRPSRLVLLAAAAMMVSSVGLWVTSRTAGLPFLPGGHMEPIGFKDATTVLFEIAALPGLLLLMSRELDTVSLPTPRLGSQALAGLAVGTFVLFTPALVMDGGMHHSADQHAAMEGHGHGDKASAGHGASGDGHGHAAGSGEQGGKSHGHGSDDGGKSDNGGSGGHDGHGGSAGDDLAAASGAGGHGHGSAGNSGSMGSGGSGGGHGNHGSGGNQGSSRGGSRGGGDGHEHSDERGGNGGGGDDHAGGDHGGDSGHSGTPPAEAAHGDDHGDQSGEDDGYDGPDGSLSWGPHSFDFEPARPGKNGKAGTTNSFVYRGPPDPNQDTRGHHDSGETCNPTQAQRDAAQKLYLETIETLKPYRNNPARAFADGFTYAFPVTDRITHMVNVDRVYDPTIVDAREIESFLYVQTDRGLWPIGGMYIMPKPFVDGPQIGGCLTKWHRHSGVAGRAVSAGTMEDTQDMLHVYTYPGLEPYGHYDGRTLASLWKPGTLIPNVCRETGDSSDVCLP